MVIATRPTFRSHTRYSSTAQPASHRSITSPWLFGTVATLLIARFHWAWRWLISGAPLLTLVLLFGASRGRRALQFLPLWTLLSTMHLGYVVASTSWLLYGIYTTLCYPLIVYSLLVQSSAFADFIRRRLQRILTQVQFVNDTVAYFDLPALEIDKDVFGLMVVRGITLSFSRLTLVAHGLEVGIMLSDDIELALQTERVTVELFRRIEISTVYANLKGGHYEMTFGNLDTRAKNSDGEKLMVSDSALLVRASTTGDLSRPPLVKMTSRMTKDAPITDTSSKAAFKTIKKLSPDLLHAQHQYESTIHWIEKTNLIHQCRQSALQMRSEQDEENYLSSESDIRAAISTMLHSDPSVPHPPRASVKVTTLRNMSSPRTKRIMHRLPLLLRALLYPLSYLHPIHFESIVAAGSGKWITAQLEKHVFQNYASGNAELRRLEKRILSWLSDANFVLSLEDLTCSANVPFLPQYDVLCSLFVKGIKVHRTLQEGDFRLIEVVRMGGADGSVSIPSFLLPHHEHLIPPVPDPNRKSTDQNEKDQADDDQTDLAQTEKDEALIQTSVHVRLPATFDQELLNFIAALVKATKVVELERDTDESERSSTNSTGDTVGTFRELAHTLNKGMKDGMKKVVAEGIVNDRWIAKMVGKITRKLQTTQGELGYSSGIPVALSRYRLPEGHPEATKILE